MMSCFTPLKKLCVWKNNRKNVAVLRLSGIIGGDGAFKKGLSLDALEEDMRKAFDKKRFCAVALQINSPGGSPVQSELIGNYIRLLADETQLPVYSFVEDVAASGGYWLACAGDEIYASVSSVVGSIGVISSGFGFVEVLKRLGIERRVYTQGERKSVLDPFQEEKKEDVQLLLDVQQDVHEAFIAMVTNRRQGKVDLRKKKTLFSGAFWNGKKAQELGLVDEMGDMYGVLREKYGEKVSFVRVSKPKSWLKRKLGAIYYHNLRGVVEMVQERLLWERFGR